MEYIKNHKVLTFFNLLAVSLIIIGSNTEYPYDASISRGMQAWGFLLLFVMVFVNGIVLIKRSIKKSTQPMVVGNEASDIHHQRVNKVKGRAIILGALAGTIAAYFYSGSGSCEEAGCMAASFVLFFLAPIFAALGAFIFYTLVKIIYGDSNQKKSAIKWFIIVAVVLAAYISYSYYEDEYGQKYCDGQPIEQYQGELPNYCLNQ